MKRKVLLFALVGMMLSVTGCKGVKTSHDKFPDDYQIAGINVGGMTADEAKDSLTKGLKEYQASITFNTYEVKLPLDKLSIAYDDKTDLDAAIDAAYTDDKSDDVTNVFTVKATEAEVKQLLADAYYEALSERVTTEEKQVNENGEAVETEAEKALAQCKVYNGASLQYDAEQHLYVAQDGVEAEVIDYETPAKEILEQVKTLTPAINLTLKTSVQPGEKAADNTNLQKNLEEANSYLNLKLAAHFGLQGYIPVTEEFDHDTIASWFVYNLNHDAITLSEDALSEFCSNLAKAHNRGKKAQRTFHTTASGDITISAPGSGYIVDANVFYEGLKDALANKKDVTMEAVYNTSGSDGSGTAADFGGHYVEVDLTRQHVYVYNNYQLVVDTDVVTGCVANGGSTPPGVYQIYTHDKDRYLNGPTWHVWVNYFCAFHSGMGFHDTTYRKAYGGSIYLYNGSHGCVNMPLSAARALYENVEIGTYVIVYGGVSSVAGLQQSWEGTSSYSFIPGQSATLDAHTTVGAPLTYSSSNTSVATVDANGNVTAVAPGNCTINVHAAAFDKYASGDYTVNIVVDPKPLEQTTISVNPRGTITLKAGETTTLSASASSGAPVAISVQSSDANAVTYENGVIKVAASAAGDVDKKVTLTVTASAGATDTHEAAQTTVTITVTIPQKGAPAGTQNP